MISLNNLSGIALDELYEAFNNAFADYDVIIDKAGLENMLERRGYDPDLSFGAFDDGRLVAFTYNGIGPFTGELTAYDTGTGTHKQYRGQGLAARIFEHSIPVLKEAGITRYLLEVLQHNTTAVNIYRKLGFKVTREFNYFICDKSAISLTGRSLPWGVDIRQAELSMQGLMRKFWDFIPSWQNSFESICRKPADFKVLGAFSDKELAGYCIFVPQSGDIAQLAVSHPFRRKGIASALLKEVIGNDSSATIKIINTEADCGSVDGFMEASGIPLSGRQFEMIKNI